jgi:hypothetical protein
MKEKRLRIGPRLAKKGNYPGAVAVELRQIAPILIELAEILENIPRFAEWEREQAKESPKKK